MILRMSSLRTSVSCTAAALILAVGSMLLGKRVNYLDHLLAFNLLAASMLVLVVIGLVTAVVSLARSRGRSGPPWIAAVVAVVVLAGFLLDE